MLIRQCRPNTRHATKQQKRQITTSSSRQASKRVFNFSAGPAALPEDVMHKAQAEFTNYHGSGMGFLEMSHRDVDGPVQKTISASVKNLRTLLNIPSNYQVLFFQGGAHAQVCSI